MRRSRRQKLRQRGVVHVQPVKNDELQKIKIMLLNYSSYQHGGAGFLSNSKGQMDDINLKQFINIFHQTSAFNLLKLTAADKTQLVTAMKMGSVNVMETALDRIDSNIIDTLERMENDNQNQVQKLLPWWMILLLVICLLIVNN